MQHSLGLESNFRGCFGGVPKLYRAPGRVNLVGEHPDCSEAYVMPAAIDLSCWAAAAPRDHSQVRHLFRKFPLRILGNFSKATFRAVPILLFDDIRLWNLLRIWKEICFIKMDMTSFGYLCGTGQGEWFVCVQHQIAGEK